MSNGTNLALQAERRKGGRAAPTADPGVSAPPPSAPNSGDWPRTPDGSARPAGPQNISRCKWANREARRDDTSQSGAADSGFPPPFVPPLGVPFPPHPLSGEAARQLLPSPGAGGVAGGGGRVGHLVTLIVAPSPAHPSSPCQPPGWCCGGSF